MSAREKLFEAMAGGWSLTQTESAGLYQIIDDALAVHAHELARQQRDWDAEAEGYTDPQMAVYAVADLIDPEADDASAGPVRPDEEAT
jgi:hypothetical protein